MKRTFSAYTGQPFDVVARFKDYGAADESESRKIVVKSVQTGKVYVCLAESFV